MAVHEWTCASRSDDAGCIAPRRSTSLVRRAMVLLGVFGIWAPPVLHAQTITLTEAIHTAQRHDRSIHIAELEREKAVREVGAVRARRFPVFSITALGSQ